MFSTHWIIRMPRPRPFFLLCLLGALSVISPFAIDLYLPAFSRMAEDYGTTSAVISLSLSAYFIGLALGQVAYGPLLDRFGRKKPLYVGLGLFILASLACSQASSIQALLALRFLQALGGCVAQVASVAMVRDFFPVKDSAKIFSLLFLFIGVSPLCAPSVGSLLMVAVGWRMVFILLALIVAAILALVVFYLPEGHQPDPGISLRPDHIFAEYGQIIKQPQFITYALAGAFSFAGLFTYVAGSPIIFMGEYHLSAQLYGGVFAVLTFGFIAGNQCNVFLLRRSDSRTLFRLALIVQMSIGAMFLACAFQGWLNLSATLVFFLAFLFCVGLTYPNAAALALEPFSRNAGSASAMLGFIQLGIGALISTCIGLSGTGGSMAIILILAGTAWIGGMVLVLGMKYAQPVLLAE